MSLGHVSGNGSRAAVLDQWRGYRVLAGSEQEVTTTYTIGPFVNGERMLELDLSSGDTAGFRCGRRERSLTASFVQLDWQG